MLLIYVIRNPGVNVEIRKITGNLHENYHFNSLMPSVNMEGRIVI